jgi:ankyrin repeat protein
MPSLFFQSGQTSQRSSHPLSKSYELTGEGLREAVKNGDVAAVKDLLSQVFICYKLSSGLFKDWWPVYSSLPWLDGVCNNGCCFQGLDANYFDKQGMSLLHLAAMFNFTEITFMLMDAGANVQAKNAQGETPIDCAQTTLGHKMRQRLDSTIVT